MASDGDGIKPFESTDLVSAAAAVVVAAVAVPAGAVAARPEIGTFSAAATSEEMGAAAIESTLVIFTPSSAAHKSWIDLYPFPSVSLPVSLSFTDLVCAATTAGSTFAFFDCSAAADHTTTHHHNRRIN